MLALRETRAITFPRTYLLLHKCKDAENLYTSTHNSIINFIRILLVINTIIIIASSLTSQSYEYSFKFCVINI